MQISTCICTFERYALAERALASLATQTMPPEQFEVIFVDNSPANPKAEDLRCRIHSGSYSGLQIRYIAEPVQGLSRARNAGLNACNSNVIAYLDDDAIAHPHWLENLASVFASSSPAVGAAGGKVLPLWESDRPPWLSDKLLPYLSIVDWEIPQGTLPQHLYLAGANIAYSVTALRNIDGFRTDLGRTGTSLAGNEEIAACDLIRAAGFDIRYCPEAIVEHTVSRDRVTQPWFRRRLFWQAISDQIMGGRRMPPGWAYAPEQYLAMVPPGARQVSSMFTHEDDPVRFHAQCKAIYVLSQRLFHGEWR